MEPEQNPILSTVKCIRETYSSYRATEMLNAGGILLAVAKRDNDEDQNFFHYTVGFPFPVESLPENLQIDKGRRNY